VAAIFNSWKENSGCVCVGVNWELFLAGVEDVKVHT